MTNMRYDSLIYWHFLPYLTKSLVITLSGRENSCKCRLNVQMQILHLHKFCILVCQPTTALSWRISGHLCQFRSLNEKITMLERENVVFNWLSVRIYWRPLWAACLATTALTLRIPQDKNLGAETPDFARLHIEDSRNTIQTDSKSISWYCDIFWILPLIPLYIF